MKRSISFALAAALSVFAASGLSAQEVYGSAEEAAKALVAATGVGDPGAVYAIFGPEGRDVLSSGVDGVDAQAFEDFNAAALKSMSVETREDGVTVIYVGEGRWPFPVPLKEGGKGWTFDLASAKDEILARRIGQNELNVIDTLGVYVVAQREYMLADPDQDGVMAYAETILSDEGQKNGLYWPTDADEPQSPLGPLAAQASADGYALDGVTEEPQPFHGYYYRVLTAQGDDAPGGAMDYHVNGYMVAGFAAIAFPADYGESGVMTFMVGPSGEIYEADLGEDTLEAASAIDAFNPGDGWEQVESE